MVTSEPTWKPQINRSPPYDGPLCQHPTVRATLRGLHLVGGDLFAALAFLAVGLLAGLRDCLGEETTGLCVSNAGLVPFLEWPIFAVAVARPGRRRHRGVLTRRSRWLALVVALAFAMFWLMLAVSTGQTGV